MTRLPAALLLLAAAAAAQDYLVITPDEFRPALKEWRAHREAQGRTIAVRAPQPDLRALVAKVRTESGGELRWVLMLGDVKQVPVRYYDAQIIRVWERDAKVPNDNWAVDLDGDDLPDLATGRLPADTPDEARAMLAKTIAYETSTDFSTWRRRLNIVAGIGGFGAWDRVIEQVATRFLSEQVPLAYDLHVTYANPGSPFCPPPGRLRETVLERFNEGAYFVTYIGHGSRLRLDSMSWQGKRHDIFDDEGVFDLDAKHGYPIVFFNACSTGHVDGAPDSLAEMALRQPRGPVAVFASSRVSMPYGNGVLAKEVLDAVFGGRNETLGEAIRQAKRRMIDAEPNDRGRMDMEQMAFFYEPSAKKREQERREHIYLYQLFADPALRLPRPAACTVACDGEVAAGAELAIEVTTPVAGKARVELVLERTPLRPMRKGDDDAAFARAYENANAWTKAVTALDVEKGAFTAKLRVPAAQAPGTMHVRVYVEGANAAALGAKEIRVTAPAD